MNLDSMNTKQLRAFKDKIDATIAAKQAKAKEDLRLKFQAMASEAGIRLSDLVGGTAGKKSTRAMKWHDKRNDVKWSGRGRRPFGFDMKHAERIG